MNVRMDPDEKALFASLFSNVLGYAEFGAGGSTELASSLVSEFVVSVDSSVEWLDKVARACADKRTKPTLVHVDIGPIGDWGHPKDNSKRAVWPLYSLAPWSSTPAARADLFLIDGRFRVACFLEALVRCRDDAKIAIHDFAPRAGYHRIRPFVDEIATVGTLSVFQRRKSLDVREAFAVLDKARYDPG